MLEEGSREDETELDGSSRRTLSERQLERGRKRLVERERETSGGRDMEGKRERESEKEDVCSVSQGRGIEGGCYPSASIIYYARSLWCVLFSRT